jgi:hypothetical protein
MDRLKRLEETHDATPGRSHVIPFAGPCNGMIEAMWRERDRDAEEFASGLQSAREALDRGKLHAVAYVLEVRVEEI